MSAQNNAMSEATAQVIDENVEEEEPKGQCQQRRLPERRCRRLVDEET